MEVLHIVLLCMFKYFITQKPAPVTVSEFIKQSYETYGFITNETIDKMRNAARLEVGQTLVESSKRSMLRATMESAKFTRKELEVLYKWFEVNSVSVSVCSIESHASLYRKGIGKQFIGVGDAHFRKGSSLILSKNQQLMLKDSPCFSVIFLHGILENTQNQLPYEHSK